MDFSTRSRYSYKNFQHRCRFMRSFCDFNQRRPLVKSKAVQMRVFINYLQALSFLMWQKSSSLESTENVTILTHIIKSRFSIIFASWLRHLKLKTPCAEKLCKIFFDNFTCRIIIFTSFYTKALLFIEVFTRFYFFRVFRLKKELNKGNFNSDVWFKFEL